MNPRSNGLGFLVLLVLIAAFFVVRIVVEHLLQIPEDAYRERITSIVLATSGVIIFAIASLLDKKAGIHVLSKHAWTSGLFESQHIFLYLPMRLVGVLLFAASFLL